jgi:hypothetical protein
MNESKQSQNKVRSKNKDDIQTIVKNTEKESILLKKDFNSGNIINYGLGHMYGSW